MREPPREEDEAQFMPLSETERKARTPKRNGTNAGCLWAFVFMLVATLAFIIVMFDMFVWRAG